MMETLYEKERKNVFSRLMRPSIDFSLERRTDNIELRYISPSSSQEKTEVASKFPIGMFDALGFTPNEHYSYPGLILIKFKRKQEEN